MLEDLAVAGFLVLKDYIATHVLTCLVPAFLLAGAMVTFISREVILDYLGEKAGKVQSFSLGAVSSFLVAACSCTVIPVASGLYYSGAGIGVAFIVLWVAPASNILALIYTGNILGGSLVIARIAAALYAVRVLPKDGVRAWLRETWWFVRIIFPLLLLGVFIVGVIGKILP
ncbi:MAG: permease [Acidobacteriota bacterium]